MSLYTAETILEWVSRVLIEQVVRTTLGTAVVPGSRTVTPGSMAGIYVGAMLIVGSGATQEIVAVTAVGFSSGNVPATFTATFANAHGATDSLVGATFPSGQPNFFLFTQSEMLTYLCQVQKDFLLRTFVLVSVTQPTNPSGVAVNLVPGARYIAQPPQAIRVERCAVGGMDLLDTSQATLDAMQSYLSGGDWPEDTALYPTQWFQDSAGSQNIGLWPIGNQTGLLECWYSDRGVDSMTLTTPLDVPSIFAFYLKYGVLAKCWEKDGEMQSPDRARASLTRYMFGIFLASKFISGVEAALRKRERKQPGQRTQFVPTPPVGATR